MDKSKIFSSLLGGIIMAAIAVVLLWGGAALISVGHVPLRAVFCHFFGIIFCAIGTVIVILMVGLVGFDIVDPHILKKQEKQRIQENAEEEKKKLRSDWLAEPIESVGFFLDFIYKKSLSKILNFYLHLKYF